MEDSTNSQSAAPVAPVAPKKRRRLLRVIAIGFCAVFLLVLLTPYVLSLGYLQSRVQSEINSHLRGECQVDEVSFSWFSGVSAQGLRISNPPGFPAERPAIVLASLDADVSIGSLLTGNLLAVAEIVGLTVNIEQRADGSTNLHGLLAKGRAPQTGQGTDPNPGGPSPNRETDDSGLGFDIKLRDCAVMIRRDGEMLESLTEFRCEAASTVDSSDIRIDADGKLKAGDITLKAHIQPSAATTDARLATHGLNLNNWLPIVDAFLPGQITALTGEANGDLEATIGGDGEILLGGNLVIADPRLAGPIVQGMDLVAKQWTITPALALGGETPSDIDASKFAIDLEWLHLVGRPTTTPGHVTLAYDLDVARLSEFGGPLPEMLRGTNSVLEGVLTMPSSELPQDAAGWIGALVTHADLKLQTIDLAGFQLRDVGVNIALDDSALRLTTSEATRLDGGKLKINLAVDLKNLTVMPAQASLEWTGGKLTGGTTEVLRYLVPLLAGLDAGATQINGDVNLSLRFDGPAAKQDGQSLLQWLDTWSGQGSIGLTNTAFEPSDQLKGLLSPLGSLAKGVISDKGKLKIDGFDSPFAFARGVVTSKAANWSSSGNTIGITGQTGFDGEMNYSLDSSGLLANHKDGQKVLRALKGKLPAANLKGHLDNPKLDLPKIEHLAKKLVEQQGQDLLQKGLNSLFKKKKKKKQ